MKALAKAISPPFDPGPSAKFVLGAAIQRIEDRLGVRDQLCVDLRHALEGFEAEILRSATIERRYG